MMKWPWELIQHTIDKFNYQSYLEVGTANNIYIDSISVSDKLKMSIKNILGSSQSGKYDLIYIGEKESEDSYNIITKCLSLISPGGMILVSLGTNTQGILRVLKERDDLVINTISDIGVSMIRVSHSNPYLHKDISLDEFDPKWLGMMSSEEYSKRCSQVVVCGIAKQEQDYLEDWVRWHLNIGFDKVYLYDNNNTDSEERYDWLYNIFGDQIEIRDVRGVPAAQISQYLSFYDENLFAWVAYIDVDEYITFEDNSYSSIKDFLKIREDADSYIVKWKCYKGNPQSEIIDKPIYEYCTEPVDGGARLSGRFEKLSSWYKSISRSGIKCMAMNEHQVWNTDYNKPLHKYTVEGNKIEIFNINNNQLPEGPVCVNHYIVKNLKEFYYKKYKRGHAGLQSVENQDGYHWWNWNQNLQYYTDVQHVLSEKEQEFLAQKGYRPVWTFHPTINVCMHFNPWNNWYTDRMGDVVYNILQNWADTRILLVKNWDIAKTQEVQDNIQKICNQFGFNSHDISHADWASCWMYGFEDTTRPNGQIPLVFNIGYDEEALINIDPEKDAISYLNNNLNVFVKEQGFFKDICQSALEEEVIIVAKDSIEYDENCSGMKDIVDEFSKKWEVENICKRIKNNTYITTLPSYNKLREAWIDFTIQYGNISTQNIFESQLKVEPNIYKAWQYCLMNLAPDMYEISLT